MLCSEVWVEFPLLSVDAHLSVVFQHHLFERLSLLNWIVFCTFVKYQLNIFVWADCLGSLVHTIDRYTFLSLHHYHAVLTTMTVQ